MRWTDRRVQRSAAFYLVLGVICARIYHNGLGKWDLVACLAMTGAGSISALADLIHKPRT